MIFKNKIDSDIKEIKEGKVEDKDAKVKKEIKVKKKEENLNIESLLIEHSKDVKDQELTEIKNESEH